MSGFESILAKFVGEFFKVNIWSSKIALKMSNFSIKSHVPISFVKSLKFTKSSEFYFINIPKYTNCLLN